MSKIESDLDSMKKENAKMRAELDGLKNSRSSLFFQIATLLVGLLGAVSTALAFLLANKQAPQESRILTRADENKSEVIDT